MRRSTLVLGSGIFITMVLLYLWVLSGWGFGYAGVQPQGAAVKSTDFHRLFEASIDKGSMIFSHSLKSGDDPFGDTGYFNGGGRLGCRAPRNEQGISDPLVE